MYVLGSFSQLLIYTEKYIVQMGVVQLVVPYIDHVVAIGPTSIKEAVLSDQLIQLVTQNLPRQFL